MLQTSFVQNLEERGMLIVAPNRGEVRDALNTQQFSMFIVILKSPKYNSELMMKAGKDLLYFLL